MLVIMEGGGKRVDCRKGDQLGARYRVQWLGEGVWTDMTQLPSSAVCLSKSWTCTSSVRPTCRGQRVT